MTGYHAAKEKKQERGLGALQTMSSILSIIGAILAGTTLQVVVLADADMQSGVRTAAALSSIAFAVLVCLSLGSWIVHTSHDDEIVEMMMGPAHDVSLQVPKEARRWIKSVGRILPLAMAITLFLGFGLYIGVLAHCEAKIGMFGSLLILGFFVVATARWTGIEVRLRGSEVDNDTQCVLGGFPLPDSIITIFLAPAIPSSKT